MGWWTMRLTRKSTRWRWQWMKWWTSRLRRRSTRWGWGQCGRQEVEWKFSAARCGDGDGDRSRGDYEADFGHADDGRQRSWREVGLGGGRGSWRGGGLRGVPGSGHGSSKYVKTFLIENSINPLWRECWQMQTLCKSFLMSEEFEDPHGHYTLEKGLLHVKYVLKCFFLKWKQLMKAFAGLRP